MPDQSRVVTLERSEDGQICRVEVHREGDAGEKALQGAGRRRRWTLSGGGSARGSPRSIAAATHR